MATLSSAKEILSCSWAGGWVGPGADLDEVECREIY